MKLAGLELVELHVSVCCPIQEWEAWGLVGGEWSYVLWTSEGHSWWVGT